MSKIKMIVTDMDYTLLDSKKNISSGNREALEAAAKKGVHIVLATGRIFASARYYAKLLNVKTPIIASNGAIIMESDASKIYYEKPIPLSAGIKMIELCRERGLYCHLFAKDTIYSEKIINISKRYSNWNQNLLENDKVKLVTTDNLEELMRIESNNILKAVVVDKDAHLLSEVRELIYSTGLVTVSQSLSDNIEIMHKEVDKGRAVAFIANMYGLKPEEIMAIGDNENDISMIKFAGIGVAVSNAEACLKTHADYIAPDYESDGVAVAIKEFVLA